MGASDSTRRIMSCSIGARSSFAFTIAWIQWSVNGWTTVDSDSGNWFIATLISEVKLAYRNSYFRVIEPEQTKDGQILEAPRRLLIECAHWVGRNNLALRILHAWAKEPPWPTRGTPVALAIFLPLAEMNNKKSIANFVEKVSAFSFCLFGEKDLKYDFSFHRNYYRKVRIIRLRVVSAVFHRLGAL